MVRVDDFRSSLESDVKALNEFRDNLATFQTKFNAGKIRDAKLDRLMEILAEKQSKPNRKAIVFTTFGDTAEYLYEQIHKTQPQWRIACVTGQRVLTSAAVENSRQANFQTVLQRFAPFSKLYKEMDWTFLYQNACQEKRLDCETAYDGNQRRWNVPYSQWRQLIAELEPETNQTLRAEIDILVATDCLSEGQNLQDADLVINYDIHWNPVRLVQRFGRIDRIGSPNQTVQAVNFWPAAGYAEVLKLAERVNNRMALMRLVGTETQATNDNLTRMSQDDTITARYMKNLIDQIANADINQVEPSGMADANGKQLGLQNLSLENFRQDLLSYIEKNRELFRRMPAGVFSGFRLAANASEPIPESLVAVLGYPRRNPDDFRTPYQRIYLMLQPVGDVPAEWRELSREAVLTFLRKHKLDKLDLPDGILHRDDKFLETLSKTLKEWTKVRAGTEAELQTRELLGAHTPGAKEIGPPPEIVLQPENFDLIAWEYVTRG